MVTPLAYFDLIETFPARGCAICNLLLRDASHLLDSLLYERVNEPDSHRIFRAARGLCNEHAWQLTHYHGGSLGIATLYQATIDEVLKILDRTPQDPPISRGILRLRSRSATATAISLADYLMPTASCMVCEMLSVAEQDYIGVFSRYSGDAKLQKAYEESEGFCLPHFRLILRQPYSPDSLQRVIDTQKAIWERLRAELREFIDKYRHERMHETAGSEGDSWQRAIGQMAGTRGVFGVEQRSGK